MRQPLSCQNTMPGASSWKWNRSNWLGQAAVIAFFGFLQAVEVGLEVFLVGPGGAVDALQHLVVAVTAPVGAGQLGELEFTQAAGVGHVRAAAQVDPFALAVQGDIFIVPAGLR